MRIWERFLPVLPHLSGVTQDTVRDVAMHPSKTWIAKERTKQATTEVRVVTKDYGKGRRYLAVVSQDASDEEVIDFFIPLPQIVLMGDSPADTLADLCQRFGLQLNLPPKPTQLVVGRIIKAGSWMRVAGTVASDDPLHGAYITGHAVPPDEYCIDLGFHIDLRSLLASISAA